MCKLKFDLNRKSLKTICISFIRHLLEYAYLIWDNCLHQEKQKLEELQTEAARIAEGATKLVSVQKLYKEVCWERLETRRWKQNLALFHKMVNYVSPLYLTSLVLPLVQNVSRYNLRNENDLRRIYSQTTKYSNSFLPSVIKDWNSLPCAVRDADSFKQRLNQDRVRIPKYFYTGKQKTQILHTRHRTGCSSLNFDLFLKTTFLTLLYVLVAAVKLRCPLYQDYRTELINKVLLYTTMTLNVLLSRVDMLAHTSNVAIFESVQRYIRNKKI